MPRIPPRKDVLTPCIKHVRAGSFCYNDNVNWGNATAVTFEAWAQWNYWPESPGSAMVLMSTSAAALTTDGGRAIYLLRSATDGVQVIALARGSGANVTTTLDLASKYVGRPIHLIVSFSNTNGIRLYFNGQLVATTATPTTSTLGTAAFTTGGTRDSGSYLDGYIGGIKVWTRELSATEAYDRYVSDRFDVPMKTSLLIDVPGNEGVGTSASALDRSGNGYHLSFNTGALWGQQGILRPKLKVVLTDPTDVPCCCLNLDASRLGLANNDPVASFTDFSGAGAHATAAGAARPTYKTNILNGLPVVRYDGSANESAVTYAALGMLVGQPFHIFIVANTINLGAASNEGGIFGNGVSAGLQVTHYQGDSFLYAYQATGGNNVKVSRTVGSFYILNWSATGIVSTDDRAMTLRKDGAEAQTKVSTTAYSTVTDYKVGRHTTGNFWNGDIAQIVCYRRRLSNVEQLKVEEYLNRKWAVV